MKKQPNAYAVLRKKLGLAQEELALFLGIRRISLAHVETDRRGLGTEAASRFFILAACVEGAYDKDALLTAAPGKAEIKAAKIKLNEKLKKAQLELVQLQSLYPLKVKEYEEKRRIINRLKAMRFSKRVGMDSFHDAWARILADKMQVQLNDAGLLELCEYRLKIQSLDASMKEMEKILIEFNHIPY